MRRWPITIVSGFHRDFRTLPRVCKASAAAAGTESWARLQPGSHCRAWAEGSPNWPLRGRQARRSSGVAVSGDRLKNPAKSLIVRIWACRACRRAHGYACLRSSARGRPLLPQGSLLSEVKHPDRQPGPHICKFTSFKSLLHLHHGRQCRASGFVHGSTEDGSRPDCGQSGFCLRLAALRTASEGRPPSAVQTARTWSPPDWGRQ